MSLLSEAIQTIDRSVIINLTQEQEVELREFIKQDPHKPGKIEPRGSRGERIDGWFYE